MSSGEVTFAAVLLTAAPPGQSAEAGGAFVKIDAREAALRSVELFVNRPNVKQILAVFAADTVDEAKRKFGGHFGLSGVKICTAPSTRWLDQIAASAEKLAADVSHVLLHDAARPIVPYTDLDALTDAAATRPAVALATPVRSVLVETDDGGNATAYHTMDRFMHLLTPQAFTRDRYLKMATSKQEVHPSELSLLKASPLNVRIGGPGDEKVAKAMLAMLPKKKVSSTNPFEEAQW